MDESKDTDRLISDPREPVNADDLDMKGKIAEHPELREAPAARASQIRDHEKTVASAIQEAERIVRPSWFYTCSQERLNRALANYATNWNTCHVPIEKFYDRELVPQFYREIPIEEFFANKSIQPKLAVKIEPSCTLESVCTGETDIFRARVSECMSLGSMSHPIVIIEVEKSEFEGKLGRYAVMDGVHELAAAAIGHRQVRAMIIQVWKYNAGTCSFCVF
jgi:hypothetical protein